MDLEAKAKEVMANGPTRVVVSADGEAVPTPRARQQYGATPDVIFIRKDGWSLGAPKSLAHVAEKMWDDEWLGVVTLPSGSVKFYSDYRAAQRFGRS